MQLAEKQQQIENLEALVTIYQKEIANLLGWLYPYSQGMGLHGFLIP